MPILDDLLSLISPNSCYGCDRDGSLLCYNCQNKLLNDHLKEKSRCIVCYRSSPTLKNICSICHNKLKLSDIYFVSYYQDVIKKLVWDLKFNSKISAAKTAANLIGVKLNSLKSESLIIIPLPTAPKRVRARGYDQAQQIAKNIVKLNHNWELKNLLIRSSDIDQIGRSKTDRQSTSKNMFFINPTIKLNSLKNCHLILIDDVMTTGSTIGAASKLLYGAGFNNISAATLAYQPRNKP